MRICVNRATGLNGIPFPQTNPLVFPQLRAYPSMSPSSAGANAPFYQRAGQQPLRGGMQTRPMGSCWDSDVEREDEKQAMARLKTARVAGKWPLLLGAVGLALGVPSAGLAVASFTNGDASAPESLRAVFTPASVDPGLARRVAEQVHQRGFRFTPTNSKPVGDRTVTVAVRVDSDTAQAISVRSAIDAAAAGTRDSSIAAIEPTRYNLGIARGYKSFARPISLPDSVKKIDMPDLSNFEPATSSGADKPGRFQPRLTLEGKGTAGRAAGTLQGQNNQSVDLGGSYRVTRNLDVTAGVRISQENDRLAPLTDSDQDNQAVYVGTQFRF